MHSWSEEEEAEEQRLRSPFGSSFRTFDASHYQPITTYDIRKSIFDLAADSHDTHLAIIEVICLFMVLRMGWTGEATPGLKHKKKVD